MCPRNDEPFIVVIPARYESSRLPGKPLAEIAGRPMVMHVYDRARRSGAQRVLLATDDERIADAAAALGAEVVMTDAEHASGTDRIAEDAQRLELPDTRIVVNVQGDEPLIPAELIAQVARLLATHAQADVATLTTPLRSGESPSDPNVVKVVTDRSGMALYFSRAAIPYSRDGDRGIALQRHVGIYAYRVAALQRLAAAPVCALESAEKLEQLRCLWLGMRIAV
ncbi:MAG TPA: 3-deoxy-manno-octulosonate cytidylyltransferase, partial [Gammaproteobacteria bacterium]|nr:3-deoxy-manno-octulosonate cytidylyltransferase [Gammaproteobacteria bacterium]